MPVIGDKEKPSRISGGDQGKEVFEVSCRRAFPGHDPHASGQFLLSLFEGGAFVIGPDPGSEISIKAFS